MERHLLNAAVQSWPTDKKLVQKLSRLFENLGKEDKTEQPKSHKGEMALEVLTVRSV